jgi:hypothetical protein
MKHLFAAALLPIALGCSKAEAPPAATPQAASTAATATAPAPKPAPEGQDFIAEARLLYRVVACQGDSELPKPLDAGVVKAHCAEMEKLIARYRKNYVEGAKPYIAKLRPAGLPTVVVYPFGGGDILGALTTYPDLTDVTTLSLEQPGDPRRINNLEKKPLADSLSLIRQTIAPLLSQNDSTSVNLMKGQRGELPGQLSFFLVGLAAHGYEPASLRFFHVKPDGTLHYLNAQEIATDDKAVAKKLKASWTSPDFSPAFAAMEMTFRPVGDANGAVRVHRHIGANLSDPSLEESPGPLKYIESKGRVSAMTKAASYLLWRDDFKTMRKYLLEHMEFMVSDSTIFPPSFLEGTPFVMDSYGRYAGSFLNASKPYNDEFRRLWKNQPYRELPFRYGYVDSAHNYHMIVTHKSADGAPAAAAPAPAKKP